MTEKDKKNDGNRQSRQSGKHRKQSADDEEGRRQRKSQKGIKKDSGKEQRQVHQQCKNGSQRPAPQRPPFSGKRRIGPLREQHMSPALDAERNQGQNHLHQSRCGNKQIGQREKKTERGKHQGNYVADCRRAIFSYLPRQQKQRRCHSRPANHTESRGTRRDQSPYLTKALAFFIQLRDNRGRREKCGSCRPSAQKQPGSPEQDVSSQKLCGTFAAAGQRRT